MGTQDLHKEANNQTSPSPAPLSYPFSFSPSLCRPNPAMSYGYCKLSSGIAAVAGLGGALPSNGFSTFVLYICPFSD